MFQNFSPERGREIISHLPNQYAPLPKSHFFKSVPSVILYKKLFLGVSQLFQALSSCSKSKIVSLRSLVPFSFKFLLIINLISPLIFVKKENL